MITNIPLNCITWKQDSNKNVLPNQHFGGPWTLLSLYFAKENKLILFKNVLH